MDMQKIRTYVVAISGLLALVTSPSASAAQEPLSAKQMEALVAKASTPAEHTQLRQHNQEMAAIYTADADAHGAMAKAYKRNPQGSPNRPTFGEPGRSDGSHRTAGP